MHLELAWRVEQERRLEARRNSLSVARLDLALGRRPGRVAAGTPAQATAVRPCGCRSRCRRSDRARSGRRCAGRRPSQRCPRARAAGGRSLQRKRSPWPDCRSRTRDKKKRGAPAQLAPLVPREGEGTQKRCFASSAVQKIGPLREATRWQTVKKQTSTDLAHNSSMTPTSVTFGRRLGARVLVLASFVAAVRRSRPPRAWHRPLRRRRRRRRRRRLQSASLRPTRLRRLRRRRRALRRHPRQAQHFPPPVEAFRRRHPAWRRRRQRSIRQSQLRSTRSSRRCRRFASFSRPRTFRTEVISRDDFKNYLLVDRGRGHDARMARGRGALPEAHGPAPPGREPRTQLLLELYTVRGRRLLRPRGRHVLHHRARRAVRAGRQGHDCARVHARAAGPELWARGAAHQGSR